MRPFASGHVPRRGTGSFVWRREFNHGYLHLGDETHGDEHDHAFRELWTTQLAGYG